MQHSRINLNISDHIRNIGAHENYMDKYPNIFLIIIHSSSSNFLTIFLIPFIYFIDCLRLLLPSLLPAIYSFIVPSLVCPRYVSFFLRITILGDCFIFIWPEVFLQFLILLATVSRCIIQRCLFSVTAMHYHWGKNINCSNVCCHNIIVHNLF